MQPPIPALAPTPVRSGRDRTLDYSMPFENGMTILRRLREFSLKEFPYVFYTKNARGSGEWEALLRGGIPSSRVIQKVDVSEDVREILDVLRRR